MQPVETQDGSLTYAHPEHGATYRSLKGARSESDQVFVAASGVGSGGCKSVLELGFGTGLNFARTVLVCPQLDYLALEPAPLPASLWLVPPDWQQASEAVWTVEEVTLEMRPCRWQECSLEAERFDVYYHDPFGPAVCPDCWTRDCFAWAARALKPEGILVTYGAATASRREMMAAGLLVGVLPGGPGKREMTVASRSADRIACAKPWRRRC